MEKDNEISRIDPFRLQEWEGLSSQAVADYFLDLSRSESHNAIPVTNLKMQKLVYFAHYISLITTRKPLIKDEIEAWQYGPVIPSLYQSLKEWGDKPITGNIASCDNVEISQAVIIIIQKTWDKLKRFTAGQLVGLSHQPGSPWEKIWEDGKGKYKQITNEDILASNNE